jgi:hypothetical protein
MVDRTYGQLDRDSEESIRDRPPPAARPNEGRTDKR